MLCIIEIDPSPAALKNLRAGRLIVINVPADMMFFSQYDKVAGHVRRYSDKTLSRLFRRCGVESESLEYWGLSMVPVLLARKAYMRMIPPADIMRAGFTLPNHAVQFVFGVLRRIETALSFAMPFGTSLLAWSRRLSTPDA